MPTAPTSPSAPEIRALSLHALILAAGVGKRLGGGAPDSDLLPKVLMKFDGVTLLERHLTLLRANGVERATLVLGYRAQDMRAALAEMAPRLAGLAIDTIENPDYRRGSLVSLAAAAAVLASGATVVLMDGDVIYDSRLMARLIGSDFENALLLDREIEPGDEPVKLCIRGESQIVDFHKRPQNAHDWHGESVGFFRFDPASAAELAQRAAGYMTLGRGDLEYEEAIRDMMIEARPGRFGFEDISGLPWTEIDFPEDIEKARGLFAALEPLPGKIR